MYNFCEYIKNNNLNKIEEILYKISKENNCDVKFLKDNEEINEYDLMNKSCIIGNKEIYIGKYDNIDLLIASYFHELGHSLNDINYDEIFLIFHHELAAWNLGLNLGMKYGYYIKPTTYKYCIDRYLYSYLDREIRECRNFENTKSYEYFYN